MENQLLNDILYYGDANYGVASVLAKYLHDSNLIQRRVGIMGVYLCHKGTDSQFIFITEVFSVIMSDLLACHNNWVSRRRANSKKYCHH